MTRGKKSPYTPLHSLDCGIVVVEGTRIREAVVVAAGVGSRMQGLRPGGELVKSLEPVGGRPILRWVLELAVDAGIEEVVLVVGFMAEKLVHEVSRWPVGKRVRFAHNPRYMLSNGVSLWVGARECRGDFALLMSDHLFQEKNLVGLLDRGLKGMGAVLAVDRKIGSIFDLEDATRVEVDGDRVVAIGKGLAKFNAIDTGMFLVSGESERELAAMIEQTGDATITGLMQRYIEEGRMGAYDVGAGIWQDVDTPEMLAEAERLVALGVFREGHAAE